MGGTESLPGVAVLVHVILLGAGSLGLSGRSSGLLSSGFLRPRFSSKTLLLALLCSCHCC